MKIPFQILTICCKKGRKSKQVKAVATGVCEAPNRGGKVGNRLSLREERTLSPRKGENRCATLPTFTFTKKVPKKIGRTVRKLIFCVDEIHEEFEQDSYEEFSRENS